MENNSSRPSLLPGQGTDSAPENSSHRTDGVARERSTGKTGSTTEILKGVNADECLLGRSYSSTSSGNSANTSSTMSADQRGLRCSQWALKEGPSSASISSIASSASLSCPEVTSLPRVDKNLFRPLESSARLPVGVSVGTSSRARDGSFLLASTCSGGPGVRIPAALVEEQQQRQGKQEQLLHTTRDTTLETEAGKCVNARSLRSTDLAGHKVESQTLRRDSSDSSWRAGRNELERVEFTDTPSNTSGRPPAKLGPWRTSRNETLSGKQPSDDSDASSLFSSQLEKAIANLARVGPVEERVRYNDSDSHGLRHFATELQRMTNTFALAGAVAKEAQNSGFPEYAFGSSGGRMEPAVTGAGRHSTTPGTSQNACGLSLLLPPDVGQLKRPTSAPPTLSKFSASTLFAFPPYDSADSSSADINRNELHDQFWRELCQTLPDHVSPSEMISANPKTKKAAGGDSDLTPTAAAAAAASLLQERQGSRMDLKQVQERLQQRGQKAAFASEQQAKGQESQLPVAALKLEGTKQLQRATSGANTENDDCVSLAVAVAAAALLRESQKPWRDDKNDHLQTVTAGVQSGNTEHSRAGVHVLSASTTGEGSRATGSISSTFGVDTPRDLEQRRLTSSFPVDCVRGGRSLQPTSLAATATAVAKGGKQDFAVSLSVPHSPVGLSSVLSSPCSSKAPTRLPHPSADYGSRSSGNNLLGTAVAEASRCLNNSPRELPAEPRILHEHHRLLLSLPHNCGDDSENVKGGHPIGTTPRITVVKIDDEKQSTNSINKVTERDLSALDAAARVLVSAAAGSKAEMLLQQLENEEREVFRCASAPPGENAASLLCAADFVPFSPNTHADAGNVDAGRQDQSLPQGIRTAELTGSESNSGSIYPENTPRSHVSQNALGAMPAEPEQRNSVSVPEEEDVQVTPTGEMINKGSNASSPITALPAVTPQQVGSTPTWTHGTNGTELPQQHQQQWQDIHQRQPEEFTQARVVLPANRFPLNSRVNTPGLVGVGSGGYPPLYNPPTMIPGHQCCVPPTAVPGCWEEDPAALFMTQRAADVAGAMAAAYGPSSPHSGVFLGHPPMILPLGTSVASEMQQQALRAAAGAFFLQHQSAAAAAAAAAYGGNSHEWIRPSMMPPLGRGTGERASVPLTAQPAVPIQLDILRGICYGRGGACCGVGGMGQASGYLNGERYFPDPLAAAASFAAIDSCSWARGNNFVEGPVGYQDGQLFGGGRADPRTANAAERLEDLPKFQHLQQPLPTWVPVGSESPDSISGSRDRVGQEPSRTTRSPRLTTANSGKQQGRESFTKVGMAAEESFDRAHSSTEDRATHGEWTTPPCDWSGDRRLDSAQGSRAAGATSLRGKNARSDLAGGREEESADLRAQVGEEMMLTREYFKGQVAALARDQLGCRLLQRVIEERGDPVDVQIIYDELLEEAAELMLDPFANYLVQKVFEAIPENQFRAYLIRASPRLVKACLSTHGTRAVQKIVEVIAKQADPHTSLKIFVDAVEPALAALVRDTNANHVIQKVVTTLPPSYCDFVFSHVETHCVEICKERHGCCVVQRCIDAAGKERKRRLLEIISRNVVELVQDSFGNYVVQYVLELQLPVATDAIVANLKGKICLLSMQKFSSNVVEKCLVHGTPGHVRAIVEELLEGGEEQFRDLLLDQYGNYVVQRALSVSHPSGQETLLRAISPCLPHLKRTSAGGCVAHRLIKRFPCLASAPSSVQCVCTVPAQPAASHAHTEAVRPTVPTNYTSVNDSEDVPHKTQQQNSSSKRLDCLNSNTSGPAGAWDGVQGRFAEERERENDSSWQTKASKRQTQQRDAVVHGSSKRRQPESCTTTWTPISRAIGIPAGRKNREKKRSGGFTSDHHPDRGERRPSSFWIGGTALNAHKGRSSTSFEQSPVVVKADRSRGDKLCNTHDEISASNEVISKTPELRGDCVDSWQTVGVGGPVMTQEKCPTGRASAAITAISPSTAVPRSGRAPSTKKHNKHRPVKSFHVSLA